MILYYKTVEGDYKEIESVDITTLIKGKYMAIWSFLNGKKRSIGLILILLAQALKAMGLPIPENAEELINQIIMWLGEGLGIAGIVHAIVKGKKNVS